MKKPMGMRIGESAFCAGYLVFAFIAGFAFLGRRGPLPDVFYRTCAMMTFLLGGDAFHLVPRIYANLTGRPESRFWLGLGNLVSSVTMTAFYVALFLAMRLAITIPPVADKVIWTALVALSLARLCLCAAPGNRWFLDGGDLCWRVARNVPFAAIGAVTIAYLARWGQWPLAVLVAVSFACYLAVVLWVRKRPMMGMLMIPKTICYIWMIAILLGW